MEAAKRDLKKVMGCLVGGAAGDALGYPVEFLKYNSIKLKYGNAGIRHLDLDKDGLAIVSDDTQMTLFTANGLLFWSTRGHTHGVCGDPEMYVRIAYNDWLKTQGKNPSQSHWSEDCLCWIFNEPRLHIRRAPGITCLSALESLAKEEDFKNDSKGCGGIMRVAPVALFAEMPFARNAHVCAANIARLTHHHPLGFMSAAYLVILLEFLQSHPTTSSDDLRDLLRHVECEFRQTPVSYDYHVHDPRPSGKDYDVINDTYGKVYPKYCEQLTDLIRKAEYLSKESIPDSEAIRMIGEGWVAEETLAIAIYSCLKHYGNFAETIISAVNHDGDSDSTGSVAGQIMGLIVGIDGIPDEFKKNLEFRDIMKILAHDLVQGCPISEWGDAIEGLPASEYIMWYQKYLEHQDPRQLFWKKRIASDKIDSLKHNEVFVFGSNLAGKHGAGAAYAAVHKFGAIYGKGVGMQGQSYAIPTMHGGVDAIKPYVDDFMEYAVTHPEKTFLVTKIGCGIAGFKESEIAPLFNRAYWIKNVHLPLDFWKVLEKSH